ncbi:DUF6415 family natural product biosynthesis protein [Streptomyces sp. NPDC052012]|uniref:DUF6415 family natural product biosynthesis protein n=1 Tax=Streptomyces sp. NPDC052012 TaxID=3155051 RepID=UPI0034502A42
MNTTQPNPETVQAPPEGVGSIRSAATWFIDRSTLPRHGEAMLFAKGFRDHLALLMPLIEQLAARRDADDVPAKTALAAVEEARRRLCEPEAAGLAGEVARVKRLARSVVTLCDHHDALTGASKCLACGHGIEPGEKWTPYDQIRPSGGGLRTGRVHATCRNEVRHTGR